MSSSCIRGSRNYNN